MQDCEESSLVEQTNKISIIEKPKAVIDESRDKDMIFKDLDKSLKEAHEIKLDSDEQNALETWRA